MRFEAVVQCVPIVTAETMSYQAATGALENARSISRGRAFSWVASPKIVAAALAVVDDKAVPIVKPTWGVGDGAMTMLDVPFGRIDPEARELAFEIAKVAG